MSTKENIPIDAIQELADKSEQAASIGGTSSAAETGVIEQTELEKKINPNQVQVNVDYLRTTKINFGMPCYGGMLTESTFSSYLRFAELAKSLGVPWTIETMTNESLICRARNTLVAKFLHQTDATHLMFVDADIGFAAWMPLALLNHQLDVVAGLYPMKTLPIKWCVNGLPDGEFRENGLQEVSKAGTGFFLTARSVYEKLKSHPSVKPYKNDIGLDKIYDNYLRTYYDSVVREGRYLSEDWTFCSNWRDLGGRVWVDRRVLLTHSGHFTFSQQANNNLLETFGEEYVTRQVNAGKVHLVDESGNVVN
jgi:hypothetical protein